MGAIVSFQQLDAWKEAHSLVLKVYQVTQAFPRHEQFGLVSQMRRAAVSVPANIAEDSSGAGLARKSAFAGNPIPDNDVAQDLSCADNLGTG